MQARTQVRGSAAVRWARPGHRPRASTVVLLGMVVSALLFVTSLTAYLIDAISHLGVLTWYDLNVYNDAGLIARQLPSILYTWELTPSIKFTYTPFAALVFAAGSILSWDALRWLMTIVSLISIPATVWLTLTAMGRRGAGRAGVMLAVSALAFWIEPVTKGLALGQVEPVLLLLVVWDLTRNDDRRWKGIGIGIAAGIKLVPLIFIPYLLFAGKIRQAIVSTATFFATVVLGFILLPGPSSSYWLTGYFLRPGRTGGVDSLVNQSLLAVIARQMGGAPQAQPVWLPVFAVVTLLGCVAGAILARSGRPVQGWVLVGVTSVLASPISWDHHWVWIVAVLAMLAGLAMTAGRSMRWVYILLLLLTATVYGAWPWRYSGTDAFVPSRGFLGWFVMPPRIYQVTSLHGWQLLTWNLFVAGGAVIFIAMTAVAAVIWRRHDQPRALAAGPGPHGTIEALLARADAVLNGRSSPAADEKAATDKNA